MIDLNHLKKIKRKHTVDKRNFEFSIRADRNEKVDNWPINIFKKIDAHLSRSLKYLRKTNCFDKYLKKH